MPNFVVAYLVRRERKVDVKTDVAVRRLERLEKEKEHDASLSEALADKTNVAASPDGSSRGQEQSREADCWQVVCQRQGLRLWQNPDWRDRLHPRQRRARCRSPHDRHRSRVQVVIDGAQAWRGRVPRRGLTRGTKKSRVEWVDKYVE